MLTDRSTLQVQTNYAPACTENAFDKNFSLALKHFYRDLEGETNISKVVGKLFHNLKIVNHTSFPSHILNKKIKLEHVREKKLYHYQLKF